MLTALTCEAIDMRRFIFFIFISLTMQAGVPWTTQDMCLEGMFVASASMDWGQTLDIEKWCKKSGGKEENPVLGPHPSRKAINDYFVATIAAHALITNTLPESWRPYWQMVWIGIEADQVEKNIHIGIKLNF
jgi:hypothetical protein